MRPGVVERSGLSAHKAVFADAAPADLLGISEIEPLGESLAVAGRTPAGRQRARRRLGSVGCRGHGDFMADQMGDWNPASSEFVDRGV